MIEGRALDWLQKWSVYTPHQLAIKDVDHGRSFTYQQLFEKVVGLDPLLDQYQILKGDRVAVFAQNAIETVLLFFALQRRGAILVPINFRLSARELDYILKDSEPRICFFDSFGAEAAEQISSGHPFRPFEELAQAVDGEVKPESVREFESHFEDPCMILYTSGTTGHPKGVMITHKMLFWNSVNTSLSLDLTSSDRMVSFLPLFHTGGWNVLLTPFIHRGATTFFMKSFQPEKIIEVCDQEQLTILFGVPTTLAMMAKTEQFEQASLSSLRCAIVGGEPMPLQLIQTWHKKGVPVRQGFGLTECGPNCFSLRSADAETRLGSIGRPNFYVETLVVNAEMSEVQKGEVGELLLKGPMCMPSYWRNPKATEDTFFRGWLKTGDLVRQDEEEFFYVVGRKKEMFISGGENVYPVEVEKALGLHPSVDEVAVIGVEDSKWGEVGKAFVVLKPGSSETEESLTAFARQNLARFKVPKYFEFLPELPKGTTGKILKTRLRAKEGPPSGSDSLDSQAFNQSLKNQEVL